MCFGVILTIVTPEFLPRDERFVLVYKRYRGASVISVLIALQNFRGGIYDLRIVHIHWAGPCVLDGRLCGHGGSE